MPSSDTNTKDEMESITISYSGVPSDMERNIQIEEAIPSVTASAWQKCCRCSLAILYVCVMVGFIFLSVIIETSSSTQLATGISVLSIIIAVLLFCFPIALSIRGCYRKNPTHTTRSFALILGMWSAATAGSWTGLYPLITMSGKPQALLCGVPLSLLTCVILIRQRKKLLANNMLVRFYSFEFAIAFLPIPGGLVFFVALFSTEQNQETIGIADLSLFITTTFWQFLFLTTSTMTYFNMLLWFQMDYLIALLPTIFLWPFLLRFFFGVSVRSIDWLLATHGENKIVRILSPDNFDSVNDTDDDLEKDDSDDGTVETEIEAETVCTI